MNISSVGIIGLGSFGKLTASLLAEYTSHEIISFDSNGHTSEHARSVDFDTVARAGVVILAIPLSAYPEVLRKLQPLLPANSLLVDVCSVKVYPEQLIQKHLPDHKNILLTHPLFGPQTAPPLQGKRLIVTAHKGAIAQQAIDFCEQRLGLHVSKSTSEEHDKVMAQVHALTFFVAEGLAKMDLPETPFTTPSYQMLTDLIQFQRTHSDELFQTIQRGNPFSQAVRKQLIQQLELSDQASEQPLFQGES